MQFIDNRADVDHDEEEGAESDDPDSMEALACAADRRDFPMDEYEAGHQARLESAAPYRLLDSDAPVFLAGEQSDPHEYERYLTQQNVSVRICFINIHLLSSVQFVRGNSSNADPQAEQTESNALTASKREHGSDDDASSSAKRRRIQKKSVAQYFDTAAEESDKEGVSEEEEEDEETLSDQGASPHLYLIAIYPWSVSRIF